MINEIFLISIKRGQSETEIIYISDSYDELIKNYYENGYFSRYLIFKLPISFFSRESPIQLLKTSKYRLVISDEEIKSEYHRIIRDQKLSNILNENNTEN